jgi:hypothetical protein
LLSTMRNMRIIVQLNDHNEQMHRTIQLLSTMRNMRTIVQLNDHNEQMHRFDPQPTLKSIQDIMQQNVFFHHLHCTTFI